MTALDVHAVSAPLFGFGWVSLHGLVVIVAPLLNFHVFHTHLC